MKYATKVREIPNRGMPDGWVLWKLSEPIVLDPENWKTGGIPKDWDGLYVISSKAQNWGKPTAKIKGVSEFCMGFAGGNPEEILVFPARARENDSTEDVVISFLDIGGSYHEESHESALAGMGYTVVTHDPT